MYLCLWQFIWISSLFVGDIFWNLTIKKYFPRNDFLYLARSIRWNFKPPVFLVALGLLMFVGKLHGAIFFLTIIFISKTQNDGRVRISSYLHVLILNVLFRVICLVPTPFRDSGMMHELIPVAAVIDRRHLMPAIQFIFSGIAKAVVAARNAVSALTWLWLAAVFSWRNSWFPCWWGWRWRLQGPPPPSWQLLPLWPPPLPFPPLK